MAETYENLAGIKKLEPFNDLLLINKYAEQYGTLPRIVMAERFDNVVPMLLALKEKSNFETRYRKVYDNFNKKK